MMLNNQTLLDEVVTLLSPERAFIVLRDPATNKPTEFSALYNFDAEAAQQPVGDSMKRYETNEYQYIWESLPYFFNANQAGVTNNAVRDSYYFRLFKQWALRTVIIVPLKTEGIISSLLWCDRSFMALMEWTPENLEQALKLVERSGRS